MHYYINPWYFYLINVCESTKIFAFTYLVIAFILLIVGGVLHICSSPYYDEDVRKEFYIKWKNPFKKFIASIIFAIVLMIFVPSEQTCTRMLISSFITEENVETAQETIKNTVDYVMDRIEGKDTGDE